MHKVYNKAYHQICLNSEKQFLFRKYNWLYTLRDYDNKPSLLNSSRPSEDNLTISDPDVHIILYLSIVAAKDDGFILGPIGEWT